MNIIRYNKQDYYHNNKIQYKQLMKINKNMTLIKSHKLKEISKNNHL